MCAREDSNTEKTNALLVELYDTERDRVELEFRLQNMRNEIRQLHEMILAGSNEEVHGDFLDINCN
tara:strand:+ start:384 stop:581 length:198 start_codon:yes stop_codon:yes gene_type:complete